jgi:DNA-binding CsgD family transcriptional regulator
MSGPATGVPLLERDGELELIGRSLDAAVDGTGGIVLIEGPPGIGKTSLALAAVQRGRSAGMRVLRAAGSELERDFGYGVVRQLFEPSLRSATPQVRRRLLDGAAGAGAALASDPEATGKPAAGSEFTTLHALYWLLANLSDDSPLLVVVDDAQWADQASLRFFAFLLPRLSELPVVMLVCARQEEWQPESLFAATASDPGVRPLTPQPLTPEASALLIRQRFGQRAANEFCAACHAVTSGNPFMLSTLVDELISDDTPPFSESVEAVLAMSPRTVTRAIVARLGRLSAAARSVARALAILGSDASAEETGELVGFPAGEVRQAALELERVAILDPRDLRFAHPIIRNAVYADLGPVERDRLHRLAAGILQQGGAPVERVATQLLASDPAGDPVAVETLRRASRAALAGGASHSAVAYLRRALAEPCPDGARVALLMELAQAERLVDGVAATDHLREALEHNSDPAQHVEIASLLAWVLTFTSETEEAMRTAVVTLAQLGDDQRDLRRRLESTILVAGNHDRALEAAREQVLAQLDDVQHEAGLGARRIQASLVFGEMLQVSASAAEMAVRAERLLADGLPLREDNGGTAFINPVQVLIGADSDRALSWLDEGLAQARRSGDGYAGACNLFFRCIAHLHRGELHDAILDGTEALGEIDRWGVTAARVWCVSQLALAQIRFGDFDAAERTLAGIAEETDSPTKISWPYHRMATVELAEARGDLHGCLDLAEDWIVKRPVRSGTDVIWSGKFLWVARCLSLLGEEHERASLLIAPDLVAMRRWGAPMGLGKVLRAQAIVLGQTEGEAVLREAVAVLAGSIAKLEHANALVDLGALLRRTGRPKEAREFLRNGLVLARACGAMPLARRAEDELRASGQSPRTVIQPGVDTLTASERRVAELAAEGLTNKQIAQALFVTVKTVETHLHRTYQKLDVSSRSQLAGALEVSP